jgi:acetyltransferase-like isoleucine patch superfamily enzyme
MMTWARPGLCWVRGLVATSPYRLPGVMGSLGRCSRRHWTAILKSQHKGMVQNPFDPGYYTSDQLRAFGFARVGEGCMVARNCTIIGLSNITLGDHVRIDGLTSIIAPEGRVGIGSYVHIASGCALGARAGIDIGNFSSLSQGVRVFTAADDFSGYRLSNATVPTALTRVQSAPVTIGAYVPIGSGTIILPGVEIGEGAAVGAMSLVPHSLEPWTIHVGNPAKATGPRSRDLLRLVPLVQGEDEGA